MMNSQDDDTRYLIRLGNNKEDMDHFYQMQVGGEMWGSGGIVCTNRSEFEHIYNMNRMKLIKIESSDGQFIGCVSKNIKEDKDEEAKPHLYTDLVCDILMSNDKLSQFYDNHKAQLSKSIKKSDFALSNISVGDDLYVVSKYRRNNFSIPNMSDFSFSKLLAILSYFMYQDHNLQINLPTPEGRRLWKKFSVYAAYLKDIDELLSDDHELRSMSILDTKKSRTKHEKYLNHFFNSKSNKFFVTQQVANMLTLNSDTKIDIPKSIIVDNKFRFDIKVQLQSKL